MLGRLKTAVQFLAILLAILRPGDEIAGAVHRRVGRCSPRPRSRSPRRSTTSARFAGSLSRPMARVVPHRRERVPRRRAAQPGCVERGDEVVALARSDDAAAKLPPAAPRSCAATRSTRPRSRPAWRAATSSSTSPGSTRCARPDPVEMIHVNVRGAETAVRAAAPGRHRAARPHVLGRVAGRGARDGRQRGLAAPRLVHVGLRALQARGRGRGARRRRARPASQVVSVNPSSVQGPGRAGGTGRIMIAYLNGSLRAFVHTNISLVDIRDCVAGHLLAAEKRRAGRALRAQRRDADVARGAGDRARA